MWLEVCARSTWAEGVSNASALLEAVDTLLAYKFKTMIILSKERVTVYKKNAMTQS